MKNIWDYCKKNKKSIIFYSLLTVLSYVVIFSMISAPTNEVILDMSYPDFIVALENGEIDTVYYNPGEEYMTITLLNDDTRNMPSELREKYEYGPEDTKRVLYPSYEEFRKDVLESGTNIRVFSPPWGVWEILSTAISFAMPILMLTFLFTILMSQMKGLDKKTLIQTSNVRFSDIIGHEEILDDVKFITKLIQDPSVGESVGAKVPKGLLLSGEPGTGKTLIAKAIAGEAGVPFLYQNASGFIEMYVGLGARRVRDLFRIAKAHAPCIIFIDEIDAIGCDRNNNRGTSENEQTINALLQEMDGFSGREGIFIIAATNRADKLDSALVRSGRFDRQIVVNPPRNWEVRKELFEHYLAKFTVSDDVDIDNLSKQVSGFTGADIAMVCNEASIVAVMQNKDAIDTACIEEAIDKKIFKGNRSKKETHSEDKKIVAYHESGHAVMSYLLGEPIARASIQSTVSGVGGAVFSQDKDTVFQTDKDLKNRVLIAYAGRASEEIKFENVTTGASNDITQATQIMLMYIEHLGFDKKFGLLDVSVLSREHLVNSDSITNKLSEMSLKLYDECKSLLNNNYDMVEKLAQKLLEIETLSGDEIELLFKDISSSNMTSDDEK
ncbi:AAA family ATPase [bacterium]|nr:AAA family ATPase [bacterium]